MWWHLTSGRNSSQAWMNAHELQNRLDACLLWELWGGQSVLPLDDSSMVIGTIDAKLGPQIVWHDCGWAALAGLSLTWRLKTERRLQPVTNALQSVTQLHKRFWMTDYSGAIFALIATTSVLTAAVVFVLAQPTDLPVVKKAQGWRASSSHLNSPKQWIRKTFSFFSSVLVLHVSLWIFTKLIVRHSTSLFFAAPINILHCYFLNNTKLLASLIRRITLFMLVNNLPV